MPTRRTSQLATILLAGPLLLAALGACSASGTPDAGSGPSPSGTPTSSSAADYQLAFAECLRDEGIDMPDPEGDSVAPPPMDGAFATAAAACAQELGPAPAPDGGSSDSDAGRQTELLQIAACLRENGVDVADPQPGGTIEIPVGAPQDVVATCAPRGIPAGSAIPVQ